MDLGVSGGAPEGQDLLGVPVVEPEWRAGDAVAQPLLRIVTRIKADQRLPRDGEERRIVVVVVLELRQPPALYRATAQLVAGGDHAALVIHRREVDVVADARGAWPGPPAPGHVVDNTKRGLELRHGLSEVI
jgi:hypothetical protein